MTLHSFQHSLHLLVYHPFDPIVIIIVLLLAWEVLHKLEAVSIQIEFALMTSNVGDGETTWIVLDSPAACCGYVVSQRGSTVG